MKTVFETLNQVIDLSSGNPIRIGQTAAPLISITEIQTYGIWPLHLVVEIWLTKVAVTGSPRLGNVISLIARTTGTSGADTYFIDFKTAALTQSRDIGFLDPIALGGMVIIGHPGYVGVDFALQSDNAVLTEAADAEVSMRIYSGVISDTNGRVDAGKFNGADIPTIEQNAAAVKDELIDDGTLGGDGSKIITDSGKVASKGGGSVGMYG